MTKKEIDARNLKDEKLKKETELKNIPANKVGNSNYPLNNPKEARQKQKDAGEPVNEVAQAKKQEVEEAYHAKVLKAQKEYQAGIQTLAKDYGVLDDKDVSVADSLNDEYAWILQDEKDMVVDTALAKIDKYIEETMHGTPDVRVFIKKALRHFSNSKSRIKEFPVVEFPTVPDAKQPETKTKFYSES